jgi:BirA family biotin operon repressor/biotin-[acetyl-CoA-carboxylase] ligase
VQQKIIQFLKQTDGYVSGEEMSQQLNMSRAAIWKHMQDLRSQGYEIMAVPHLGYQLVSNPDVLSSHEIKSGLKTKLLGQKVFSFETLPSTMDEAFRLGMQGADEGTLICAESQTKGRGRLGRAWASPKGKGIYCSIILRPKLSPSQMSQLTLMTAVAVAEAVKKVAGVQPTIKWPNDLMIGTKKLSGILTELRAEIDALTFVVVGLGINVNSTASQLLETATSLKMETYAMVNRVDLLQEILISMEKWYGKVLKGRFEEVLEYCRTNSATLKKQVSITDAKGTLEGKAVDIDTDGGLLIRLSNGKIVKKISGDALILK